jgi:hypothetical protein
MLAIVQVIRSIISHIWLPGCPALVKCHVSIRYNKTQICNAPETTAL